MPEPKEPNFFAFDGFQDDYQKKDDLNRAVDLRNYSFSEYQALYTGRDDTLNGDASTAYFIYPDNTIGNIMKYYGDYAASLKLVLALRNPVDKIYSHYLMFVKWGVETRSFRQALGLDKGKVASKVERQINYVEMGYLADSLEKFQRAFSGNLKVVLFDDLVVDKLSVFMSVVDHIGFKASELPRNIDNVFNEGGIPIRSTSKAVMNYRQQDNVFRSLIRRFIPLSVKKKLAFHLDNFLQRNFTSKPKLDSETRKYLETLYREDVRKTEALLGRDLSAWIS